MASQHILMVDDDALLRRSLAFNLEQAGYRVSTAERVEDALAILRRDAPQLILLDINLPGIDGLEGLRQMRATLDTPVIFLTARRRELDQVVGLELGGDDYLTKPFDVDVLLAHIRAVLRRAQLPSAPATQANPLVVGDLVIDLQGHTVTVGGQPVDLPPREFALLHALALEAGHVLSVDQLLTRVWGAEYVGESQVVYVHIRWLRDRLEADPSHPQRIVSMRGVGYKLVAQDG
jgi:DNA-binding response OmpR family regulator